MVNESCERGANMKYKNIFPASCLVAAIIAVPATLRADTKSSISDPAKVQNIANHLSTSEEQAAEVSRDAETVWSLSQDHHTNWQSRAYYSGCEQDGSELEEMKPEASEAQQMPIERARPHFVSLANETSEALDLLRVESRNLTQPQYEETVADLSRQAEILYQTVDTIVDYHRADDRLDKLEASHS
jgi:hypothetical protein